MGQRRWARPVPPEVNTTLQTGAYGPACIQGTALRMIDGMHTIKPLIDAFNIDLGKMLSGATEVSEDCLFLDVYVPAKAFGKPESKLPVINWIYGGGYVLGSKGGNYDGTPVVKASNNSVIYVSGNYRVGSFGFLAGNTLEKEGTPNAGLWDQRAVLEWIQKYIVLFGGDWKDVTVWGTYLYPRQLDLYLS
jgi:carboxylesterase type B